MRCRDDMRGVHEFKGTETCVRCGVTTSEYLAYKSPTLGTAVRRSQQQQRLSAAEIAADRAWEAHRP